MTRDRGHPGRLPHAVSEIRMDPKNSTDRELVEHVPCRYAARRRLGGRPDAQRPPSYQGAGRPLVIRKASPTSSPRRDHRRRS